MSGTICNSCQIRIFQFLQPLAFVGENSKNINDIAFSYVRSFAYSFARSFVRSFVLSWPSPIFEKIFFPAENTGNMPEIAVFGDFHGTFSLYFAVSFHSKTLLISLFRSFVCSFARSFVCSYFHYQVGPIFVWLVGNNSHQILTVSSIQWSLW